MRIPKGEKRMAQISRMRTVKGIVEHFKAEDKESPVNEYMIRRLIKQKKVPVLYAGNKALINLDLLIEYFNSTNAIGEADNETNEEYGTLRKVKA